MVSLAIMKLVVKVYRCIFNETLQKAMKKKVAVYLQN